MAKKYYAVKAGRETGIFDSWEQCKRQVDGYPSAIYKSFSTLDDAKAFMLGGLEEKPETKKKQIPALDGEGAVAYVDGSYDPQSQNFSCGVVLFHGGKKYNLSKKYEDSSMAEMRNVAGEIMGATEAINYCLHHKIPELEIYHDYEGVARWADGSWKANKEGTKAYARACKEAAKSLKIRFVKVKGHSGDKYNDQADLLAKKALGLA